MKNRFHIYAKRRFPKKKNDPRNVTRVDAQKHKDYHILFGLRTPEEILHYLNSYFWNNRFEISIKEVKR